ncbi:MULTISPECIES: hypothetical protein [Nitrosomonas]|uniref:Uncharacterized protein n=1 Tax=Nitrosomonas communis TaxID=44574 RepID=A0A0F7KDM4_9PROT|nr:MULTISPECIES: hypothetical protein [Nitrosomonas]AKH36849.1 hypothetical protein AAW31_01975 [Nitrosomonas communis]TYP82740.1 hypothetical protein BCL69_10459 [Nitrosomonas communis]UVS61946.1 hypothetical protein NX761_02085 [Nitrosomonas sp. PLL12]
MTPFIPLQIKTDFVGFTLPDYGYWLRCLHIIFDIEMELILLPNSQESIRFGIAAGHWNDCQFANLLVREICQVDDVLRFQIRWIGIK